MGIDSPYPTYIDDLDATLPAATDPLSQADDHIRMIKTVLKQTFPNVSGAVTPTDASLNLLSGLQSIADAVYPVGCIYESTVATDPSTLFPGTSWTAFGQGKVIVGLDPNDGDFNSTSDTGGSKTVALTTDQMPSHNHGHTLGTADAGTHGHSLTGSTDSGGSHSHGTNLRHGSNGAIVAGQTTVTAGSDAIDVVDVSGRYGNGTSNIGNNTTSHSGHTHSLSSGSAANAGSHSHSITGSISNAGSGNAHDNMPPYIVVYRWKRDS